MGLSESTDFYDEPILNDDGPNLSESTNPNDPNTDSTTSNPQTAPSYQERLNKTQTANLRKRSKRIDDDDEEPQIQIDEEELNEEKMWIDAIAQDPKSSHLRNQLANHYFSRNRLKEAEFAYKAAIGLDPSNAIAHYDFAFMRHHQFYWALSKFR